MKIKFQIVLASQVLAFMVSVAQEKKIVIESLVPVDYKKDSAVLYTTKAYLSGFNDAEEKHKEKILNNKVEFSIITMEPLLMQNLPFYNYESTPYFAEPGDQIRISGNKDSMVFTGKGSKKYELVYYLNKVRTKAIRPDNPNYWSVKSVDDFLQYAKYIKDIYLSQQDILDGYAKTVGPFIYRYYSGDCIDQARFQLTQKFWGLVARKDSFQLSEITLRNIYDSTFARYKKNAADDNDTTSMLYNLGLRLVMNTELIISRGFKPYESDIIRHLEEYNFLKSSLKGLARERSLVGLLTFSMLRKSLDSSYIALTNDYLSSPGYPEYKKYVQEYLSKELALNKGRKAIDFSLMDVKNRKVTLKDLKGKVIVMDFWFTGCKGCVQMVPGLKKAEEAFHNNPDVVFLSICTDNRKEQWISSIAKKKYTTGTALNLYTEGQGINHPIITSYNVTAYPQLFVIDTYGKFTGKTPDPRKDEGKGLIELINKALVSLKDGPYVLYKNDKITVKRIEFRAGKSYVVKEELGNRNDISFNVNTDTPSQTFKVVLKDLKNEPGVYEEPDKILALSDIEGNFDALRKLLQANGVIGQDYKWTFGKGHLVVSGDMFDRGNQVTECLWLIYSLEEQAKESGGYVHYILGNHEIMNLSGDVRYVQPKYLNNTTLILKESYGTLFGENSELGRWLRTKNIIEKVGGTLFVHGGISEDINNTSLSVDQINQLARPYYGQMDNARNANDETLRLLYGSPSSSSSPFWNRTYYAKEGSAKKTSDKQIDSTLQKFGVRKIVTGHTIIEPGDKVTAHYNNKVINTDTEHAEGKSEALLIEGDKYYRVNVKGERILLENEKALLTADNIK